MEALDFGYAKKMTNEIQRLFLSEPMAQADDIFWMSATYLWKARYNNVKSPYLAAKRDVVDDLRCLIHTRVKDRPKFYQQQIFCSGGTDPIIHEYSVEHDFSGPEKEEAMEAVARLEDRHRDIIQMYFFDELNQREIADIIGVSESAISGQLKRILSRLRRMLGCRKVLGTMTSSSGSSKKRLPSKSTTGTGIS